MLKKLYAVAFLAAVGLLAWAGWSKSHQPVTAGAVQPAVVATPAATVEGKRKRPVPVKGGKVQAYPDRTKEDLGLPAAVAQDAGQVVTSAVVVPPSEATQQVVSVTDTRTGDTVAYVKEESLPWLAPDVSTRFGAYYGLHSGEQTLRLGVAQNLLRVKQLKLQGVATYDQSLESDSSWSFVGIGFEYNR